MINLTLAHVETTSSDERASACYQVPVQALQAIQTASTQAG